jgi:hypothetical protein
LISLKETGNRSFLWGSFQIRKSSGWLLNQNTRLLTEKESRWKAAKETTGVEKSVIA